MDSLLPLFRNTDLQRDLNGRKQYVRRCIDFALWDGPEFNEISMEMILGSEFDVCDNDVSLAYLDALREKAYWCRVRKAVEEIVGEEIYDVDVDDFVDRIMDNWGGEPMESTENGLEGNRDAVLELWANYRSRPGVVTPAVDPTIEQALREATTELSDTASEEEAAKLERLALREVYYAEGKKLKERAGEQLKQLNHIVAMLYNARFPKHVLPKDYQIYTLTDLFTSPKFDHSTFDRDAGWSGNVDDLCVSGQVRVDYERLNKAHYYVGQSLVLKLDVDFQPRFTFGHDGSWVFGHRDGRLYIDGGVTSIADFTAEITKRLKALE